MYDYKCRIVEVYDGDTVKVDIDLGFGTWLPRRSIRVAGIDTPEIRTRNKREKRFGYRARDRMRELLPVGSEQVIRTYSPKPDKYGRILANFEVGKMLASEVLIAERLGVYYDGQSKDDIKAAHLANWEWLDYEDAKESE